MSFMQAPRPDAILSSFIEYNLEFSPRYTQAYSAVREAHVRYAVSSNTIPSPSKELKQELKKHGALIMGDGRIVGARVVRPHWNR